MVGECRAVGGTELDFIKPKYAGHKVNGLTGVCVCVNDGVKTRDYAYSGPGIVPPGNASLKFTLKDKYGCQGLV